MLGALALTLSAPALAQTEGAPPERPIVPPPEVPGAPAPEAPSERWWLWGESRPSDWTLQLTPRVWFMGLGGDIGVQGGAFDANDVNIDDPEFAPAGEARIRAGKLTFSLSGFGVATEQSAGARNAFTIGGVAVAPGQPVQTEIDIASAELTVGYKVWSWAPSDEPPAVGEPNQNNPAIPPDVELRLDLYGGARFLNFATDVTTGGATISDDGYTLHPLLGARLGVEMFEKFSIDLLVDAGLWPGGTRDAFALNVIAGISWRPWGNLGFEFGYRILRLDMDDGSQSFDGTMAGLIGSVVLRF